MADYIKTLVEDNGDNVFPTTKGSSVILDDGVDLQTKLNGVVTSEPLEDIVLNTQIISGEILQDKSIPFSKLKDTGMGLPRYASNLIVDDDTPGGWSAALGGRAGYYIVYYFNKECFASQPSQWGYIEVFSNGGYEISQVWHSQGGGDIFYRSGDGSGWAHGWIGNYRPDEPIWSTIVNTTVADNVDKSFVTKKGTKITYRITNGGTGLMIISGGESIRYIEAYGSARFTTGMTSAYGIYGVEGGSKVYVRKIGGFNNGTWAGGAEMVNSIGSDVNYGNFFGSSGSKVSDSYSYRGMRIEPNGVGWRWWGNIGSAGALDCVCFESEIVNANGVAAVPCLYQRGATASNVGNCINILRIMELP